MKSIIIVVIIMIIVQILEAAPYKTTAAEWLLASHLTNYPSKINKTCYAMKFSYGLSHMDTPEVANKQGLANISSVQTLGAV